MTNPTWQKIDCGQEQWWVAPNWRQQLLNQDGLRLQQWTDEGKVEIVKHSLNRTVYRVGLAGKPVYVKHYEVNDYLGRVRSWLRQAKAWIEWRHTVLLQERSVPTVTPVAVGRHPNLGSYIITEEIPDAQPLQEFLDLHWEEWKRSRQQGACQKLVKEIGTFLAQMLKNGIVHDDLHAGNVLVHTDALGHRNWYLIDPYNVQRKPRSHRKALLDTLALMIHNNWHRLSAQDRLRGWLSFRQSMGLQLTKIDERRFLTQLHDEIQSRIYSVWNQRVRRNTKANRDFYELRVRRSRAWASRDIPADWLAKFLFEPEQSLKKPVQVIKRSRHGLAATIAGPTEPVLIKKFTPRHVWDRLFGRWRRSPALHCYRMAYRLYTAFLPTARPLAVVEKHRHGQLLSSYVLTEYLKDTVPLGEYWPQIAPEVQQQTLLSLAGLIQRLHSFRLSHRDLKLTNILARHHGEKPVELFLIDLRGVTHSFWLTTSRRQKDLARLALSAITSLKASRTDLLRFLRRYLKNNELPHWRKWWKQIAGFMSMKIRQNHKRNRIVS
jgi:tRNA A-37 threonylcarbamoyl transferase component Bud32